MKRMALLFMVMLAGLPTLQTEAVEAWRNVERLPAADAKYVRYFTIYNLPTDGGRRRESRKVSRWFVNSLSMRRRMAAPVQISDTVYRVDLRDYGWSAAAWDALTAKDGYQPAINAETQAALYYYTGAPYALTRLDRFAAKGIVEPDYSRFLGLPGTLKELFTVLGVQEEAVKKLSLNVGGAVIDSGVTLHNRQLERYPTITGYFWGTKDVGSNVKDQAVLDNLNGIREDAGEFLFSLPNELQAGYLANAKGEKQDVAPANIAIDRNTAFTDKQIFNYRSCIGCHEKGIITFRDVVSSLIRGRKLAIDTYSKEKQIALEDFYLSPLGQTIAADQVRYTLAVQQACGLTPQEVSRQFLRLVYDYQEQKVDAVRAARELGIPVDDLPIVLDKAARAYPAQSLSLLAIAAGESLPVDQWEQLFGFAAGGVK